MAVAESKLQCKLSFIIAGYPKKLKNLKSRSSPNWLALLVQLLPMDSLVWSHIK